MAVQRRVYDKARIESDRSLERRASAYGEAYFETTHAGLVVEVASQYLGDGESAYYAVVWNPGTSSFEQVWYASDREPVFGTTAVDAAPALLSAWAAEKARRQAAVEADRAASRAALERLHAEEYARTPRPGSIVRVAKGRKVKLGIEGRVFWVAPEADAWGRIRAGFESREGERIFIDMANLEVLEQPADRR